MSSGLIGGLAGLTCGLIGGLLGTFASIRTARGPRERRFVIWAAVGILLFAASFLALLFSTPYPWRNLWFLPYILLLVWTINRGNRVQDRLRREEAGHPHA